MVQVKSMIEDAISSLINNTANSTDWELVYYEYYIYLFDEEVKRNLGNLLLNANVEDEQKDKIDVLKSVVKENLGKSRVMK